MSTQRECQNMFDRGYVYAVILEIPLSEIGPDFYYKTNRLINRNRAHLRKIVREYLHAKYHEYKNLVFKNSYVRFPYQRGFPCEIALTRTYCRDLETATMIRLENTHSQISLITNEIEKTKQKAYPLPLQ